MSATLIPSHVVPDAQGVLRVGGVKYIMFLYNHVLCHMDVAALHEQYPKLSMGELYGALSYYHDHKTALDAELERREKETDAFLKQHPQDPHLREKLLARLSEEERQKLGA